MLHEVSPVVKSICGGYDRIESTSKTIGFQEINNWTGFVVLPIIRKCNAPVTIHT